MINWQITRDEFVERGRKVGQAMNDKEQEIKQLQFSINQLESDLVLLKQEYWGHYRILANMDWVNRSATDGD